MQKERDTLDIIAFKNPPSEYRPLTFWGWNGRLTEQETRSQLRDMSDHGLGGGFMHSRQGLVTEYLGDEWFSNCTAAIDEGKRVDFDVWVYDEDRWPSGSCSGRVAEANSDYLARVMIMTWRGQEYGRIIGPDEQPSADEDVERHTLARFRIRETAVCVEYEPVSIEEEGDDIAVFNALVSPSYTDLMHPDAVAEFLHTTYDLYAKKLGRDFPAQIPGIFTDEPGVSAWMPWSVIFRDEFRSRCGYDLLEKLPALFLSTADASAIRHDYRKTVMELLDKNYFKQIGDWCDAHGVAFTGHIVGENDLRLQTTALGALMPHYMHMTIPGVDSIMERIHERLTMKQCASVCRQFDKPRMISETFAVIGYHMSFETLKWIGDWQMALGVNMICGNMSHYTLKGCAKRDYPPSIMYQSPWWRHYLHLARYHTRLSYVLSQGQAVRDILLIHPVTSEWCTYDPISSPFMGVWAEVPATERLDRIVRILLELHRDFDFGDETIMAEHACVEGDELIVGSAIYKVVVVPEVVNLESTTLDLLEQFVAVGGKVIWLFDTPDWKGEKLYRRQPTLENGRPSDRPLRLAEDPRVWHSGIHRCQLNQLLESLLPRSISVARAETGEEAATVLCQHRKVDKSDFLFLANTDREAAVDLKVCAGDGRWERWDCETGAVHILPSRSITGGMSEVALTLPPVGAALLRLNPHGKSFVVDPKPTSIVEISLNPDQGWEYERLAPNSLVLDCCTYRIDDGLFSNEMFLVDAQEEWRKKMGLSSVVALHDGLSLWKLLQNPENCRIGGQITLRYIFSVRDLPQLETYIVLEDRAQTEIFVNGIYVKTSTEGWFMDRSFERVPIGTLLKVGENIIEIVADISETRVMEDIYITGDFGVDSNSLALVMEPDKLQSSDWCVQGYPFYTDGMMYKETLDIPDGFKGQVVIKINRFEGTVAAVHVNQKKVAVLGWRPYEVDVTEFIHGGHNEIGIEVVGSPRNLMGPRHATECYPAWMGRWQLNETAELRYHFVPAGLMGEVRCLFMEETDPT